MTRKLWLITLGAVALALAIALLALDPSREAEGNPGIVDWEFAWSEERAAEILEIRLQHHPDQAVRDHRREAAEDEAVLALFSPAGDAVVTLAHRELVARLGGDPRAQVEG